MFLASTSTGEYVSFLSGRMWRFDNRAATDGTEKHFRQLFLPFGVCAIGKQPSVAQYGNRLYIVGGHSDNLVVDEHERIHRMGIMGPSTAPTINGAAGTGRIAYVSLWDELTNEHSPLSGGTEIGAAVPRTWVGLPTYEPNNFAYLHGWVVLEDSTTPDTAFATNASNGTTVDGLNPISWLRPGDKICDSSLDTYAHLRYPAGYPLTGSAATLYEAANTYEGLSGKPIQRASHVCLWLSVAGGLPRLVTKIRLGVESVTESVSTAMLGEAHPGTFDRFPICSMNAVYHDRLLMAGDPNALDTVYLSQIGYPERYEGFKFKTRNGESVTGLLPTRDYCLIMTEDSTYILQGYTEDDMVVSLADNGVGAVGHRTNTVVNGTPYVVNRAGMHAYNGTWHPVMLGADKTFSKHYANNRDHYKAGYLLHNPVDKTVQLFLGLDTEGVPFGASFVHTFSEQEGSYVYLYETCTWVVNYETVQPQAGGGFAPGMVSTDRYYMPLSNATQHRLTASAYLPAENGVSYLYHGTNKGMLLREEEDEAFLGEMVVVTPHYLFDSAGGFEGEGNTLTKFWTHCSAEQTNWYACALGGDEWVGLQSLLTSTDSYGIDNPNLLDRRLWGAAANRLWSDPTQPPAPSTARNGFGVEHYAHYITGSFLTGSSVPSWVVGDDPLAVSWVATPKSVHEHPLPDSVSGRGICFVYYFLNPKNVIWRGMGGVCVPGPVTRPTFFIPAYY